MCDLALPDQLPDRPIDLQEALDGLQLARPPSNTVYIQEVDEIHRDSQD